MTFPVISSLRCQGQYCFFDGRNDANMEREKSQLQNSNDKEMSWEGGTRGVKYGFRGSFSLIHHLPNYMKSRVEIAFGSISQVPGSLG